MMMLNCAQRVLHYAVPTDVRKNWRMVVIRNCVQLEICCATKNVVLLIARILGGVEIIRTSTAQKIVKETLDALSEVVLRHFAWIVMIKYSRRRWNMLLAGLSL